MPPFDSPSPRRAARLLATALLAMAALFPLLTTQSARGDDPLPPTPITTGAGLDWGIKESLRTYIVGPIAHGSIALSGGATPNPDGTFRFGLVAGVFDANDNSTVVQFAGTVRMQGHEGALDLTVADPRIEITAQHARLFADLRSRSLVTGNLVDYGEVLFATLALDGVDPVVGGAPETTSWSAVPVFLAPAATPAFMDEYAVGTEIDPLSFSYEGPGGKPTAPAEHWSLPGVPAFDTSAHELLDMGAGALEPDPADDVVHVVGRLASGRTGYRALDPGTLATVASLDDTATTTWSSNAQQTSTQRVATSGGTLWAASTAGPVQPTRFESGAYAQDAAVGGTTASAPTNIRLSPDGARMYLLGGPSATPWARTLDLAAGVWTPQDHVLDGSRGITDTLLVDADGVVLETHRLGTPSARPIAMLDFGVSPLGRDPVADSLPDGSEGLRKLALAPGGVLYGAEADVPLSRVQRFVKGPSGYAADGPLLDTNAKIKAIAADPDDGTLWLATETGGADQPLLAVQDGVVVDSVALPAVPNQLAVMDGTAYATSQAGDVWAVRQVGSTPEVTDQPGDATVVLDAGEASQEVVLEAAATGTPAPSVQWQSRPPGATWFADVAGATASQLPVEATVADDGTEYRAVFANDTGGADPRPVGTVASDVATLDVSAAPSVAVQPADVAAIEGDAALLKMLPAGHPAPDVQWQRLDGGAWTSIPGATELFLSIPATTLAMDGTTYRVLLENAVGTATSQTATLSVTPRLAPSVTFGSGHVDWGVKASFRSYIEGPIAHGSYTASDGAVRNGDGTIRFELLGGTYDTVARSGELQLRGTVRFSGHDAPGGPQLDLTLRDPRLVLDGDGGTLHANATSKALGSGALQQFPGVALASLDMTGAFATPLLDGLGFTALPAALTPAGVPVFAQYAAGVAMDPLTVVARYGTPRSLPDDPTAPPPAPPTTLPPPADVGPPAPPSQAIAARSGSALLDGAGRTTTVAVVTCRRGPCRLTLPRRASVRIGGRTFRAAVLAPRTIASGRRAHVRVRLTRRAASRLGCRRGTIALRIGVAGADGRTSEVVAVTVRRPASRC